MGNGEGLNKKCTKVIPTYNRPYYLRRLLSYYGGYPLHKAYKIIIADSSSIENKEQNKKNIEHFPDLDILYLDKYPTEVNQNRKISDALGYIESKYCVICADDDFITPQGIRECVDFLEKNNDFTVAQGLSITFWSNSMRGDKQQFFWELGSNSPSVVFTESRERLVYHLSNYFPTFYSVHRTDFLRMIFKESSSFTNDVIFEELLLSMLTLLYGKMKFLDVFYSARDKSGNIKSNKTILQLDNFISKDCYNEKYSKFKEALVMHLSKNSQLNISEIEESKRAIDDTMSIYLSTYMKGIKSAKRNLLICEIKDILGYSRLTSWMYGGIRLLYRKLFPTCQKRIDDSRSLENTPLSNYYQEVNQIYKHLVSFPIPDNKIKQSVI